MDRTQRDSQCSRILKFMRTHGSITSMQAFKRLSCTRLSGRIYDLKEQGYRIKDRQVSQGRTHFKRYSLA